MNSNNTIFVLIGDSFHDFNSLRRNFFKAGMSIFTSPTVIDRLSLMMIHFIINRYKNIGYSLDKKIAIVKYFYSRYERAPAAEKELAFSLNTL